MICFFSVQFPGSLGEYLFSSNLLTELDDCTQKCFRPGWASWHVNVDGEEFVYIIDDAVGIVKESA